MPWRARKIECFEDEHGSLRHRTSKRSCSKEFTEKLQKERKSLKITMKFDKCKAVLFYWPIVSRAGIDIQAALQKVNTVYKDKYVALVVLHHTFDPACIVPDSNITVNQESQKSPENPVKLLVVDCLFHEDQGLLKCSRNKEAVEKVAKWLQDVKCSKKWTRQQTRTKNRSSRRKSTQSQKEHENPTQKRPNPAQASKTGPSCFKVFFHKPVKCFEDVDENTKRHCKQFTKKLQGKRSMKMTSEEKCEAVLFYRPVVSRAGTDIQAALQKLNTDYPGKYVVLVVLHHTFDPTCTVPDSNIIANRENQCNASKLLVVDCLFHEDQGLLQCPKNDEAVETVAKWLRTVLLGREP